MKKLIATCITEDNSNGWGYIWDKDVNGNGIMDEDEVTMIPLEQNGDFRSPECIEFLKEADIVVTNPPMELVEKFDPVNKHLHYDNYNAYNVDKVADIPYDTDEVLGVPITITDRIADDGYIHFTHNKEEMKFEIVAFRKGEDGQDLVFTRERESSTILSYPCTTSIAGMIKNAEGKVNGKITYARITIKKI